MAKFKKGDMVICVNGGYGISPLHVGKIFKIKEIGGDYIRKKDGVRVVEQSSNWNSSWIGEDSFELFTVLSEFSYQITLIAKEFQNG